MNERRFEGAGKFVWHELVTSDPKGAEAFYSNLFGWTFSDVDWETGEDNRVFSLFGEEHGHIASLGPDSKEPSFWIPYVTVSNVPQLAEDVEKLEGATLRAPTPLSGFGRYSVFRDPQGGIAALFDEGNPTAKMYTGPPRTGTIIWNDIITDNAESTGKFYSAVFDWNIYSMQLGEGHDYYLLKRGEIDEAGIIPRKGEQKSPAMWLPYVTVDDVSAACLRIAELGGALYVPPSDLHGAGHYAVAGDPSGAPFAIFQPSSSAMRGSAGDES